MQHIKAWSWIVLLLAGTGFSKTIVTARDQAEGSDAVLESAVDVVKSIPVDAANVVGDVIQIIKDETGNSIEGVKSAFSGASSHEAAQLDAQLAVEQAWDLSGPILFRSYKVSEEVGQLLLTGIDAADSVSVDVSSFFDAIEFDESTSAYYMPSVQSLLVYQKIGNVLKIEQILAHCQGANRELLGHQVEIETKFVEVSQSTLNELGFSWSFAGKDGGPLDLFGDFVLPAGQDLFATGLRTASGALGSTADAGVLAVSKASGSFQWDLFISALEQDDDSDVLSAPRVVTLDGNDATIHVGERRMMPQSFGVENGDSSAYIEHTDWEDTQLGVLMEVTPELRDEGLIDLSLNAKISELIGYDGYDVQPAYEGSELGQLGDSSLFPSLGANDDEKPALTASIPYCRVRELETVVTVSDGSTVGMGGLIYDKLETFRDKVPVLGSIPFLGRLFRSEGEQSVKRNLMIFVTATQVDVDGRRNSDVALNK